LHVKAEVLTVNENSGQARFSDNGRNTREVPGKNVFADSPVDIVKGDGPLKASRLQA